MMTFDQFMDKVFEDYVQGGITWGQAYMRALNRHLPELVDRVKDDPHLNPGTDAANLAEFLFLVRAELQRRQPKPEKPKLTEGWGVIRPGDRKVHYYRDGMSLCRRVGFYSGELEPDTGPSTDDHAECRKILDKEKAKQPA